MFGDRKIIFTLFYVKYGPLRVLACCNRNSLCIRSDAPSLYNLKLTNKVQLILLLYVRWVIALMFFFSLFYPISLGKHD